MAVAPALAHAATMPSKRAQAPTATLRKTTASTCAQSPWPQVKRQQPNKCKRCGGLDHVRCVPGRCPAHPDFQPRSKPTPSRKRRAAAVCRACGQSDHVRSVRHRCPMYGTSGPPTLRRAGGDPAPTPLHLKADNMPKLAPSSLERWLHRPQQHAPDQDQESRTTAPEKCHSV